MYMDTILILASCECVCVRLCVCVVFMDDDLPVSQRRNNKPFSAAQEFILVAEAHICDVDDHLVWVLIEVETALLQPLKVIGVFDMEPALEVEEMRVRVWRREEEIRRVMESHGESEEWRRMARNK